jgi:hypothetical protein
VDAGRQPLLDDGAGEAKCSRFVTQGGCDDDRRLKI